MYVPVLLSVDPITPDHILVPLTCGHYGSIFDRSSWWYFPDEGDYCEHCHTHQSVTPEGLAEIRLMMSEADVPEILPEQIDWTDVGLLPKQELLAHIRIAGMDLHLSAIAVYTDQNGMQAAAASDREEDLNHYAVASGHSGKFQTTEINGITYAIFATPFSA